MGHPYRFAPVESGLIAPDRRWRNRLSLVGFGVALGVLLSAVAPRFTPELIVPTIQVDELVAKTAATNAIRVQGFLVENSLVPHGDGGLGYDFVLEKNGSRLTVHHESIVPDSLMFVNDGTLRGAPVTAEGTLGPNGFASARVFCSVGCTMGMKHRPAAAVTSPERH